MLAFAGAFVVGRDKLTGGEAKGRVSEKQLAGPSGWINVSITALAPVGDRKG
jgi:hypothetical protein